MASQAIFVILSVVWTFATLSYFLFTPSNIDKSSKQHDKEGYWGNPDAEFNWCEDNYIHSYYVAELWNTITSSLYIVCSCLTSTLYWKLMSIDLIVLNILTIFVGIGSILFHATLRYSMQLFDELPMFWLSFLSSITFYWRDKPLIILNAKQLYYNTKINFAMITFSILTSLCVIFTDKQHSSPFIVSLHYFSRNILVVGFLLCFLYDFMAAVNITHEIDDFYQSENKLQSQPQCNKNNIDNKNILVYYKYCFSCLTIAMICWIIDNFFCHKLRNLPFGLGYPHLHAFGWHLGTTGGMYMLCLIIVCHRCVMVRKEVIQHKYFMYLFPYISFVDAAGKKNKNQ